MVELESSNKLNSIQEEILSVIKENNGCYFKEIKDKISIPRPTIYKYLHFLRNIQLIEYISIQKNRGKYYISNRIIKKNNRREKILQKSQEERKYRKEKIVSIIRNNVDCYLSDIISESQLSYQLVHQSLKILMNEGIIKKSKRGLKSLYYIGKVRQKGDKFCSFCGKELKDKFFIYNIYFPSMIYCADYCKRRNAPGLSDKDYLELLDTIENNREKFNKEV